MVNACTRDDYRHIAWIVRQLKNVHALWFWCTHSHPSLPSGGDEGSSKRNIQRKAHGGGGGGAHGQKGKWDPTDDGSLSAAAPTPGDPSYSAEEASLARKPHIQANC